MGKQKLRGKDLKKIGFPTDKAKSIAIGIMATKYKHLNKTKKLELLENVQAEPDNYKNDPILGKLAVEFMEVVVEEKFTSFKLAETPKPYRVYGKKFISQNTIHQMDLAMRLPVAKAGALMPDAHVGYGLPIGGVLATKNEVIPYAVGLDIGCRMALSIFDAPGSYLTGRVNQYKKVLLDETHFGLVKTRQDTIEHEILDRREFRMTELLRSIHGKAIGQLGTSGTGNHFVEFGELILEENNALGRPAGSYLALVSHSGSRAVGATIANYFKSVATDVCRLPRGSEGLAWLDLNSAEGQEYWLSMNLAGDYAKACHDVIHQKIAQAIGLKPLTKVENHHNFAWKEKQANGEEWIVHRKGATPAQEGVLGIIPGSMATTGYLVTGLGNENALFSASHGAGRKFSRSKAKESYTGSELKKVLKNAGVTLIGGGRDEAPFAYKDIETVMANQTDLVKVEGRFIPKIVRMCKD